VPLQQRLAGPADLSVRSWSVMNTPRAEERTERRAALPFHPVLFAIAPILFVYVNNARTIPIDRNELLVPTAMSLAVTGVLWTLLGLLLRSVTRAALVVSLFLVLFFSYGHVAGALAPESGAQTELLLLWALLLAAGVWLAGRHRRRGPAYGATVLLNCVSAAVLAVNLATGVNALALGSSRGEHVRASVTAAFGKDYPDIFYIVTDAYTRSDILSSHYHTDNSAFVAELRRLGFFVADRSRSNYAQTYLSLSSSLNFTYLDSLVEASGPELRSRAPLVNMIQNSRLVDFLRRRGYTIVSFASSYNNIDLASADIHLAPRWTPSEFQGLLMNTTLLRDALGLLGASPVDLHRARVLYTLRELPGAVSGRHPVFVWAHMLAPHPPFVFDARGEWPDIPRSLGVDRSQPWLNQPVCGTIDFKWYEEYYGPQVTYLNALLIDVVKRILARSPRPPIIIIQGDHGPGSLPNWNFPTRRQLLEQTAIMNAIYLPPAGVSGRLPIELYDSITPVNTFRVILSQYFDTTLALLPDRSYLSVWGYPYHLYNADRPELYPTVDSPGRGN
jgi:hypothetical protein